MKSGCTLIRLTLGLACLAGAACASAEFALQQGDHITIVGNALPDRMQHDGWLESYLQLANPDKDLVIRNMGFTGDQVNLRPRNENFMPFDDGLKLVETDVLFVM